jgi:asparagine synthetase B (glutamine-hydrolysing)
MCGITGYINTEKKPVKKVLKAMTDKIQQRAKVLIAECF